MNIRPHQPIQHNVVRAPESAIVIGKWLKMYRGPCLRTVWVREYTVSDSFVKISFTPNGPLHQAHVADLLVFGANTNGQTCRTNDTKS